MSEMIERVARAIYEALDRESSYVGEYRFPRGERGAGTTLDGNWDLDNIARAAIRALREPSDQMIDAVYKNEFIQAMRPEDLYAAWESMIEAALGEKP